MEKKITDISEKLQIKVHFEMQPEQPTEINVGPQHVYIGQKLKI